MVKNYLIDIDGTICDDIPNETPELFATAKVYPDALERLNKWHDEGHTITFFTARPKKYYMITTDWLIENGFKGKERQQIPQMSDEKITEISNRYIELYEQITGEGFVKAPTQNVLERIDKNVTSFLVSN